MTRVAFAILEPHRRTAVVLAAAAAALALCGDALGAQRPEPPAPRAAAAPKPVPRQDSTAMLALRRELARVRAELRSTEARLRRFEGERSLDRAALDSLGELVARTQALRLTETQLEHALQLREVVRISRQRIAEPRGWLGLVTSSEGFAAPGPDGVRLRARTYPVIVSVEPGSPAERAGLMAGDRLVALKGMDLRERSVALRELLRPGTKIPVRVERGGELRDVVVTVTPRPDTYAPSVAVRVSATPGEAPRVRVTEPVERAVRAAVTAAEGAAVVVPIEPGGRAEVVRSPAAAPAPPVVAWSYAWSSTMGVAGMEVTRVTPELREALSLPGGVLVLTVGRGSLAEQAGLRAGDVIVRAGDTEIATPVALSRRVQRWWEGKKGDALPMEVVRGGERRQVALRR